MAPLVIAVIRDAFEQKYCRYNANALGHSHQQTNTNTT